MNTIPKTLLVIAAVLAAGTFALGGEPASVPTTAPATTSSAPAEHLKVQADGVGDKVTPTAVVPLIVQVEEGLELGAIYVDVIAHASTRPGATTKDSALRHEIKPSADLQEVEGAKAGIVPVNLDSLKPALVPGNTVRVIVNAGPKAGPADQFHATLEFQVIQPADLQQTIARRFADVVKDIKKAQEINAATAKKTIAIVNGRADGSIKPAKAAADLNDLAKTADDCADAVDAGLAKVEALWKAMINNRVFTAVEHKEIAAKGIKPLATLAGVAGPMGEDMRQAAELLKGDSPDIAKFNEAMASVVKQQELLDHGLQDGAEAMAREQNRLELVVRMTVLQRAWDASQSRPASRATSSAISTK